MKKGASQSDDEIMENYLKQIEHERKRQLDSNSHLINDFKAFCKTKGVSLTDNHFDYVQTIGIVAKYPDIVLRLDGNLSRDKEGLVDCSTLYSTFTKKHFMSGYLYHEKFMAMANPCFRRGMYENNNYAPRFIDLFWMIDDRNIELHLSLDFDRVRVNVDDSAYVELDTWYGAKFNKDIRLIQDGVTKLRPPMDLDNRFISFIFADAYSMDVKWETKGNIKTFQSEEFKTSNIQIDRGGKQYYPVRYIHAEFDMDSRNFRHFDGAVHYYAEDEYFERRDSDLNYNAKSAMHLKPCSEKLFKFNGSIKVDMWVEFCSHFYTANPLVIEYFSGSYPDHTNETLDRIKENASQ